MKKRKNNHISTIIFIYMMVLCVVLSSPIKNFIDTIDDNKKETSELLEEETDTKEDSKKEKELFSFLSIKSTKTVIKNSRSRISTTYNCQLNSIRPFFKVHTPPPDFVLA